MENFNGIKYFLFDDRPVKTVWEDGIIVETYSIDPGTGSLVRNDRLAFYIETQASDRDEISEEDYKARAHKIYLALPKEIKTSQAIDQHKDTLDKLK
ncbi:hypothetical protein [Hyphococcus sp.]|uniref:hypothetical protein n=1 Tax=Hyphococcus sp. TaxID=2038636 RepID=UPI0035C6E74A